MVSFCSEFRELFRNFLDQPLGNSLQATKEGAVLTHGVAVGCYNFGPTGHLGSRSVFQCVRFQG